MDEAELRRELARLEAEEELVSAQRRNLHQKIDFGYATDEARAREREISDQRRELHRKIDSLRELLGVGDFGEQEATLERRFQIGTGDDLERLDR
jgi:hypothetical protein